MTKYWEPGRVKTRLGQSIGMESAALLHRLFVSYLCENLVEVGGRLELCVSPPQSLTLIGEQLRTWGLSDRWGITSQCDGDLGVRIRHWFHRTLMENPNASALLIGSDCPTLTRGDIQCAAKALDNDDVVLGPAVDGGYYLIGIRGPWRPEFDSLFQAIPWSTDRVFTVTKKRLAETKLTSSDLDQREDVDTIEELMNLRRALMTCTEHSPLRSRMNEILKAFPTTLEKTE
ncbi:MAG: TIGR04282 family arsenosugar biosynthesis glycosyltransferase [Rubripirellula sp.]